MDELDRARPDYAVRFLETLKHFFQTKGIIFILAVDKAHLESSVKSLYGSDINFPEYYRKFVHRNVSLKLVVKCSATLAAMPISSTFYAHWSVFITGSRHSLIKFEKADRDLLKPCTRRR